MKPSDSHGQDTDHVADRASDAEVLASQDALLAEADGVVADLELMPILEGLGRPTRTGSSALGVMVARDIDITTVSPGLDPATNLAAAIPLVAHRNVQRLQFRNDTGRWNTEPRYPDGLYWMIDYVSDEGISWKLDLWFLLVGTTQFDLEHMKVLPTRMTPEARATIIRIKQALADDPPPERIPSYDVYAAVLDDGVTTAEEFLALRRSRA